MSDAKSQQEPSMEEILASIRRIISDDNEPAPPSAPAPVVQPMAPTPVPPPMPAMEDDVLELTQFAPSEEPEMEDLPDFEPEPPRRPQFASALDDDRLVSNATAVASSAAFASVSERMHQNRRERDVMVGNGAGTLEELVKDALRPMLRDWLDQHLPEIVERIVREEVERLAREAI